MTASSADNGSAPLVLNCTAGSMSGQALPVEGDRLLIGRADDCGLSVDPEVDVKVSGHHAAIEQTGDAFEFTDLGSTNGSLINGRPVEPNKPVRLTHGAKITLGEDAGPGTVGFTVALKAAGGGAGGDDQIAVTCPSCAEQFGASRAMMGRKVPCVACGAQVEVPITTKLFSGGGTDGGVASSAISAPPKTGGGSSAPAQGADGGEASSPGFIGKMKKAVHNFREKREVQDQLKSLTDQAPSLQSKAGATCTALGQAAWDVDTEAAAALPGGVTLQERQGEIEGIEAQIAEAGKQLKAAEKKAEKAAASWAAKCEASSAELQLKQDERDAAATAQTEAEDALRQALDDCLTEVWSASEQAQALVASDLSNAAAELEAVAQSLSASADAATTAKAEVDKLDKALAKARASFEKADAALQSADEAHEQNEQDAKADAAEHDAAGQAIQSELAGHEAALAKLRQSLGPAYLELGQALVQQQGAGMLGEDSPELAQATEARARQADLQAQIDTLQDRLQTL